MRPAFSSTRQAAAFAVLMLLVLLSPALAGKKFLPAREESYSVQGWSNGPYPWIRNQIFEETNDIDIAFMGSSRILHAFNTPYLQQKLSEKLGRPSVVRTIAWGGAGFDALFFMARDLMAHRRVHMLVIYDEDPEPGFRNNTATSWFRFGDDAPVLAGLPLHDVSLFYMASIIGMPKNLLELVRPNIPAPLVSNPRNYWESHYHADSMVKALGATRSQLGFNYDKSSDNFTAFTPFTPQTAATPSDVQVYSGSRTNDFEFEHSVLPLWQLHFVTELEDLASAKHCKLVMVTIPVINEASSPVIRERAFWPALFDGNFSLIGIPPTKLFGGLTDQQLHLLFTNRNHFNQNGMDYFTKLLTPTIMEIYEDH